MKQKFPIHYEREGKFAKLDITLKEGAGYRWVPCLALLDDDGRWLCSQSWRTNHHKKAMNTIEDLGWRRVDESIANGPHQQRSEEAEPPA